MQFVVPQYIDIESKIIGPISTRQFILVVVLGVIGFLLFRLAPMWMFIVGLPLNVGIFGTFAFLKVNGQPFHVFALSVAQTLKRPGLRVWNQEVSSKELRKADRHEKTKSPKIIANAKEVTSKSRLAELSLIIDTGGAYQDNNPFSGIKEPYNAIQKARVRPR
ncbi:MAG: hypothetical protein A3F54_00990 [Candidatus Kerfeldbacteria bacterium RIFCSPHIGHO2_12_FULL_48_17]|uniref:PrgI family protein n=1 Tax=Candidatus Kerfeldbacteria bacterium RIFCSPHIGHO2_12_FULL_48_17 TaxID=1798542 RepID=A0A1G2AWR9_9BACT|nr:MAG: hypothetical protein A3F54_00990 [Candidatus Kerfeldbacteria bacterium RIFCSPHIGHO2_12_FULL_48_17]